MDSGIVKKLKFEDLKKRNMESIAYIDDNISSLRRSEKKYLQKELKIVIWMLNLLHESYS